MKIATFNVNGRLPVLLRWLGEAGPDIVCLQELKAPDEKFPEDAIREAGYEALWHGQRSWNGVAILSRGAKPIETRRGLPGDPADTQSRYLEAAVKGVLVGCLYLPNGNPAPGPKFDYKLEWFERLTAHAETLLATGAPVVLAGDYNVMPTDLDVYKPERWLDDALFRPEVRDAFHRLAAQGWTDALRTLHPEAAIYTFWDYFRNAFGRDAGLRIDHLLLSPALAPRLQAAGVDRAVRSFEKASDHAPVWIRIADGGDAGSGARRRRANAAGRAGGARTGRADMADENDFDLGRFASAQDGIYGSALEELRAGRKRSHWMWFVFPQMRGLGRSPTATFYGIASLGEARAYLAHPVLGPRLREATETVLGVGGRSLNEIFGSPDDMKFCSSMTLFAIAAASRAEPFRGALEQCCGGREDERTLALLGMDGG